MAIKFNRSPTATFETNGTVTAAKLHNLVDATDIYQALITDQTNLTSVGSADELLIADADLSASDAPRAVTVNELFEDALTISTYTNANINNISYGTSTGTRLVATNASITTGTIPSLTSSTASITIGTIPTLTAGTTTSTAANITNGTIQTITSSTLASNLTGGTYSGAINSTAGTVGTLNSTNGTIQTLTSSTGTIGNFSTTLGGDFTISQGTGTLGTTGVTVGTYGTSTEVPRVVVDAKGRITGISTVAITQPSIIQVLQTVKTDAVSASVTTYSDISGMSVSITPSSTLSKILVHANLNVSTTGTSLSDWIVTRLVRDSTPIYIGDAAGSRTTAGAAANGEDGFRSAANISMTYLDSPTTSSAVTYKVQWDSTSGVAQLNMSAGDANFNTRTRHASSITVMEVV